MEPLIIFGSCLFFFNQKKIIFVYALFSWIFQIWTFQIVDCLQDCTFNNQLGGLVRIHFKLLVMLFCLVPLTFASAEERDFDLPVFKEVSLPSFPNMTVPVYQSSGRRGPGVLLIHGNSSSSRSFAKQFFLGFGRTYKLFLLDLPGHGLASKVDANLPFPMQPNGLPLGFPEYQVGLVEAVATVANDPDVMAQVFVGWSLGGDILLLTQGAGLLPNAKGLMMFGTAPAGANPPTAQPPFIGPYVPGIAGLSILASFGFSFQADATSPIGFNLNGQLVGAVPAYAPAPISNYVNKGEAYVSGFFNEDRRLNQNYPDFFLEDAFERSDDRFRSSIGVVGLGLLPPESANLPDELQVLQNLAIPIAVLHGSEEAFVNKTYLEELQSAGYLPTLWNNQIVEVQGAGHAIHFERPIKFNNILRDFIKDLN